MLRSSEGIRSVALPGWLQVMIIVACLGTFGGVSYLAVGYFAMQHALVQTAAAPDATADTATVLPLADLNRQLSDINNQYAALKSRYDALTAAGSVNDLRAQLKQSEQARLAEQSRNKQLQAEMETVKARASLLKALLDSKDQQLQQLSSERDKRAPAGDKTSMAAPPVAPPLVDNPEWDAPAQSAALETGQARPLSELERLIASTGIDLDRLLHNLGSSTVGQGGPFVAADGLRNSTIDQARNAELLKLVKTLPLASPLGRYEVESAFGIRSDPFNGRSAFHSGIDLGAYYRAPVYSTGPGVVSFTGVKGSYGRVVEIDHGHGIVTRYAHLHRILVARGQRIAAHTEVGELGSTGRSTGPHLHYEVMLDGRPVDPAKFLKAGKNVVRASTE